MQNFDEAIARAKEFAATPQGRQLAELLGQMGAGDPRKALDQAAAGDFSQAARMISALMTHPEGKKLLETMGGAHGNL